MASPSSLPRQMPEKLTTAPISVRALRQRRDLPRDVEIGFLNADGHGSGHGRDAQQIDQPPVIGGKNAISRAPAIMASGLTWAWSIAARITRGVSKAWA